MAVASRTPTPKVASAFLRKLGMPWGASHAASPCFDGNPRAGLESHFQSIQLIPFQPKDSVHFPLIRQELGREGDLKWENVLFFDDEQGNITRVSFCSLVLTVVALSRRRHRACRYLSWVLRHI